MKQLICYGCNKGKNVISEVSIATNGGSLKKSCHVECIPETRKKMLTVRNIDYNEKLKDIQSDMKLVKNAFVNIDKSYSSWEISQKEKVINRFRNRFQKLLSELYNRPYNSKESPLIDELGNMIVRLSRETEILKMCSIEDRLSDSKEIIFVRNGDEWYEKPMRDIYTWMFKHGYPNNTQGYITDLIKAMKKDPYDPNGNPLVEEKYQNAMMGIFDQLRILLTHPNRVRLARMIYKLHRQYQFSPRYLGGSLFPLFNFSLNPNEIMNLSSFQEVNINGDPKWTRSLAVLD